MDFTACYPFLPPPFPGFALRIRPTPGNERTNEPTQRNAHQYRPHGYEYQSIQSNSIYRHQFPRRLVEARVLPHERREARLLLRRRDGALEAGEELADRDARGGDLGADFFAGGEGSCLCLGLGCCGCCDFGGGSCGWWWLGGVGATCERGWDFISLEVSLLGVEGEEISDRLLWVGAREKHRFTRLKRMKGGTYQDLQHGLCLERALYRLLDLDFQLCFPVAIRSCLTWSASAFSCGYRRSCRRQSQRCLLCRSRSRDDVWRGSWGPCSWVTVEILGARMVLGESRMLGSGRWWEDVSSFAFCGWIHCRLLLNSGETGLVSSGCLWRSIV